MNVLTFSLVLVLLVVGSAVYIRVADALRIKVDRRRFLQAIDHARPSGTSRYWLTREVWGMHTVKDFAYAENRMLAWGVAERHFDWLLSAMLAADMKCTVENMALAWIAGIGAVRQGGTSMGQRFYARYAARTYDTLQKGDEQ